jgi:hypothetical protein
MVKRNDGEQHYILASVKDYNKKIGVDDKSVTFLNAYDYP